MHVHLLASTAYTDRLRAVAETFADRGATVTAPLLDDPEETLADWLRDAKTADAIVYLTPQFCDVPDDSDVADRAHAHAGLQLGWAVASGVPIIVVGRPVTMTALRDLPQTYLVDSLDEAVSVVLDLGLACEPAHFDQAPGQGGDVHVCDTGFFDRTVCPEPCGTMHSYCTHADCGARAETCAHDLVR